jgi:hypothetical protein
VLKCLENKFPKIFLYPAQREPYKWWSSTHPLELGILENLLPRYYYRKFCANCRNLKFLTAKKIRFKKNQTFSRSAQ